MMATLRIQRNNEFINKARNYCIYVDGQKAGTIANGETKDFIVTSGQHQVVAKIDWCSSPTIFVNATDADTCAYKIGTILFDELLAMMLRIKWVNEYDKVGLNYENPIGN
ncbi:MAG: hypothetical protein JSS78_08290 [Bacteroidetes bacterium]|nr:hypothetical protein [Bacteroidota bacterium]